MEVKMDPGLTAINKIGRRHTSYLVYRNLFKSLRTVIQKYGKGNVLDVGCGNKPYQNLFNDSVTNYTGCDIKQSPLNNVDIICSATDIPLPDNSFNTVLCTQLVEHVYNYPIMLKEFHRLLDFNGILFLSGPMYWPVHGEPHDFFRFTKFGFEKILEEHDFEIMEILENGGAWATAGQSFVHAIEFSNTSNYAVRFARFLFFRGRLITIFHRIFSWLDKTDYCPTNTINYVIVAKKK